MDFELAGKVALVTGGASGIGAQCVRELVDAGAQVVVSNLAADAVEEFAAEMGGTVVAVAGDVRSAVDVEEMVRTAVRRFGRLDLAVNNAGVGVPTKRGLGDGPRAVASDHGDQSRRRLPQHARRTGRDAADGRRDRERRERDGCGRHGGRRSLRRGQARRRGSDEGRRSRVRRQGDSSERVGPGFIDTPLLSYNTPERLAEIAAAHPVGRLGTAVEIAQAILFLLSPAASFLTGPTSRSTAGTWPGDSGVARPGVVGDYGRPRSTTVDQIGTVPSLTEERFRTGTGSRRSGSSPTVAEAP
jgi:NAD(P)-dependent dehydrogenase (short-subunit alcohol dehydrogenase family)